MGIDPLKVLEIAVLLGLVIFVHELGHFLVARWAGVLVERFSIGFGPVLFSIKRGETEYALSLIPLGGYVKMLGQTDTPEVEEVTTDQRSYQNKPVASRMAIISAGVCMNVLFGFACFAIAYRLGVEYQPAVIGSVIPGRPAWNAGMAAGDQVVAIDGKEALDYETLIYSVALTRPPRDILDMRVLRDGHDLEFHVAPVQEQYKPVIGVLPALGLRLASPSPTLQSSPARAASSPGFEPWDTIRAVNGQSIANHRQLQDVLFALERDPVTFTVIRGDEKGTEGATAQVRVDPNYVRTLGLTMQMGKVVAIQDGSPAASAKDAKGEASPILPDDVLKAVDGVTELDPMRLADVIGAKAGKSVELTVLRPGREQTERKIILTPRRVPTWIDFSEIGMVGDDQPMSIPSIGVAYRVLPTVKKVAPKSPAATAKEPIRENDVVRKVEFDIREENRPAQKLSVDVKEEQWPSIVWTMQHPAVAQVKLTIERAGASGPIEVTLSPERDPTWPIWTRGLFCLPELAERKVNDVFTAMHIGMEKTLLSILRLYLFLRGLIFQTISSNWLAGPITIASIAYRLTDDFAQLVLFLGMININLAVINFLPIPILDGGHMVFLIYEGIFRRKPSERFQFLANNLGFFLIVLVMIFVFGLDIYRHVVGWF